MRDFSRHPRNWRNDPEMVQQRRLALTVDCPYCGQPAGEGCVRLDDPGRPELIRIPAHPIRVTTATRGTPT